MYTSFFGLKSKPFQLTPDPEFLFPSKVHKRALTYLNYGIASDSGGFILVTGEVGTGKTTVIRSMVKRLKEDVIFSRINNTRLTSEQLIAAINDDFGLDIQGKDKTRMLKDLTDFLIEQYGKRRKSILVIDEAQNLTPDLLEEIRLLSNLETDKSKLLQIILAGQPELKRILDQPEMRALRQRINVSCHIYPLTREETEKYILHRLEIAGNREAISFEAKSIDLIHNFARGIPRLINIACDFLLLCAYIEQKKMISLEMAQEVIGDLEKENKYWQDENPEEYSGDVRFPGEITKRLVNSKEGPFQRDKNAIENRNIFENISEMKKLIASIMDHLKTELINMKNVKTMKTINIGERVNNIEKQIKEIKTQFPKEVKEINNKIKNK